MKALLLTMLLSQGADLATTHIGLKRGCVEMNPLYGTEVSLPVLYAAKGTSMFLMGTVAWGGRKSHPKLSRAVLWTGIAVGAGAAIWNLHQLPRC